MHLPLPRPGKSPSLSRSVATQRCEVQGTPLKVARTRTIQQDIPLAFADKEVAARPTVPNLWGLGSGSSLNHGLTC